MRLWFCDMYEDRVCSIAETGSDLRVEAATPGIPSRLGWLPDGRLLVVVQNRQRILRREEDGSLVEHADLSRNTVGPPNDLTITAPARPSSAPSASTSMPVNLSSRHV
jgi:sugar lactone lactonase YvrE